MAGTALIGMQFAFVESMVLKAAVKLDIADIIGSAGRDATLSAAEIGAKLPTSSAKLSVTNLNRLLRAMVLYKLLRAQYPAAGDGRSETRYGLTPVSELLVSGAPQSLRPLVRMQLHKAFVVPWLYLDEAVLDGAVEPFDVAHDGKDMWAVCQQDEQLNSTFNDAMASMSRCILDVVLPRYQGFKDARLVVDVGGGVGLSLRKIIQHNPHVKGINFDLPHVVATAPDIPGVTHVGGNMFESVPQADVIYMKWLLHDWTDEQSIQILKNCWDSLPDKGGKVVVLEQVVPPQDHHDSITDLQYAVQMDLVMLACTSGKERAASEWQAIFSAAGFFRLNYVRFPGGPAFPGSQYIIEAFK